MVILALTEDEEKKELIGMAQYNINEDTT